VENTEHHLPIYRNAQSIMIKIVENITFYIKACTHFGCYRRQLCFKHRVICGGIARHHREIWGVIDDTLVRLGSTLDPVCLLIACVYERCVSVFYELVENSVLTANNPKLVSTPFQLSIYLTLYTSIWGKFLLTCNVGNAVTDKIPNKQSNR